MYLLFLWRMLTDRRVPGMVKVMVAVSLLYSLFPRTWFWGPWDNLILLAVGAIFLFLLSPRSVLRENLRGRGTQSQEGKGQKRPIVDAKYHFVDEESQNR